MKIPTKTKLFGHDCFRRRRFGKYSGIVFTFISFLVLKSVLYHQNLSLGEGPTLDQAVIAPTHRDRKSLPNFSNGGIVIFYHTYKTGGSTVGKLFHQLYQRDQSKRRQHFNKKETAKKIYNNKEKIKKNSAASSDTHTSSSTTSSPELYFTMIRKNIDWKKDCLVTLNMAKDEKKLILLELHVEHPAPSFPSLVELSPMLNRWRKEADNSGIGFFAFTLVREPIAHALSFFNFFHVGHNANRRPPSLGDHDYWNPFQPLNSSESNFLRSYFVDNRQCRMFDSDPEATHSAPDDLVWIKKEEQQQTETEADESYQHIINPCRTDAVHNALFKSLDWVGTTENLQNETLPLLTKLVANDPSVGRNNAPYKVFDNAGKPGMKKGDLSEETLSRILEKTRLDRRLYNDVICNFTLADLGWDYKSFV